MPYRDWEQNKTYSAQEALNSYISLIMQLSPGQAIVRIKPSKESYLLEFPEVKAPKVSEKTVSAFLQDMAKHWYR